MNRTFLFILLLLILWFILGLFFCNKYLCGLSAAAPVPVVPVKKDKCGDAFIIKDKNAFNTKSANHYAFLKSNFTPLTQGSALSTAVTKTVDYLKSNADRRLTITGYYADDEKNSSILDNLGLARANSIKRALMNKGVPGGQLDISSRNSDIDCYRGDTLRRGATFAFADLGQGNDRVAAIKDRLFGKPITLYFGTDQDNISLTGQQRTDFTDLIYYLDNVNTAKLGVSGHTDNVGDRAYNVNLSKERAEFVRDYLKRNGGINDTRMDVGGFGPDKPVATNATADGKAKNRRVEVTLQ